MAARGFFPNKERRRSETWSRKETKGNKKSENRRERLTGQNDFERAGGEECLCDAVVE